MSFESAVQQIIKKNEKIAITSGTVTKVTESCCDVLRDDLPTLTKVRYNSILETPESYIRVIPKEGSYVLCGIVEGDTAEAIVLSCSEIEKVELLIGEIILLVDENGYKINGDNFSGLVKAPELKTQVDKNTAVIKAIQEAFTNWITAPNDGGAALKGLAGTFTGLQRADLSSIENEKVKHGG